MSARQPFFTGMPTTNTPPISADSDASEPMFQPDLTNPLHSGKTAADNGNAPLLNVASLTKGNRDRSQNNTPSRRASMNLQRPGTSDPHSTAGAAMNMMRPGTSDPHTGNHRLQARAQSHAHGIVAPTPRKNSQPPPLFASSFKAPALPASHNHQDESMYALDLDRLTAPSPMRLAVLPSQPGPHRISFAAPVQNRPLDDENDVFEVPNPKTGKRTRGEMEDDGEQDVEEMQQAHKRFKPAQDDRAYSRNEQHDFHRHSSSPHDQSYQHQPHYQHLHHLAPAPQQQHMPTPSPQAPLSRLLGLLKADTLVLDESVIEGKIARYERSAQRWRECDRDEWLAGADEITAMYGKVFDFVKAHMTTKLALFTSCDTSLAAHTVVLSERDALLVSAKEHLVNGGGEVLGETS
ncbi:hypothetical protein C8F01DRAFT_1167318 [Mycena amicta]|nr:hypothetical protein C8F01DRAFT_1167318 [Mycena amicta]